MKAQRGKTPCKKTPAAKRKNKQTDPVQVYCRIRPLSHPDILKCVSVLSPNTISVKPGENSHAVKVGAFKESEYTFENVFDEFSTQKAIFEHVASPLVEDVVHGKNALLFAYGVTSSGKTHTMTGSPQDQGILPRCLDVIFNSIVNLQAKKYVFKPDKMNGYDIQSEADAMLERQKRDIMPKLTGLDTPKTPRDRRDVASEPRVRETSAVNDIEEDNSYCVFVSYVEIYNNYIYDLLEELQYDPITGYKPPTSKTMREDKNRNMYISNVIEVEVKSTEEAYEVIHKGQKRRKVAHTTLNTESSRSHSVFNIRLVQAPLDPQGEEPLQDKEKVCVSQLALVDLAGSERTNRTNSAGDRLREAGNINQSLMVLRSCIEALRDNQINNANKMVPYRDSRLTHLFKNYFDGEGRVRMVVCVNPHEDEYDETIQVMKFAELTREVQVARSQQVRFDVGLARGRRQQNQRYKEAISKAVENGDDDVLVNDFIDYSMGPAFPSLELNSPVDTMTLVTLMEFLKQRELMRSTLLTDLSSKEESFRRRLIAMEQENRMLKAENDEMKAKLASHSSEVGHIQRKMRSLEKANEALQRSAFNYQSERRDMEKELDEKDYQIRKAQSDQLRLKQDYHIKIAMTEQQIDKKVEETKRKLQKENDHQLRSKQQKLDMLRNIMNQESDADSIASTPSTTGGSRPRARTVTARYLEATSASRGHRVLPAKSEPDLSMVDQETPRGVTRQYGASSHLRSRTAAPAAKTAPKRKSPPPTKPKPAMNIRHRRSRSHGDVWLDHKPVNTVDTGTILQPAIKRKKSVSKLTEQNTKDANKYLLTHQEADSDGGIATKLVKGDIIPTAGGGAAVVFNDVETIKQTSPGTRKRRSPQLNPEDFEGEWTDTEDRCKTAIEHHGHLKRLKSSAV